MPDRFICEIDEYAGIILPPVQMLIMEVLAARFRLGENCWTFSSKLRPAMKALEGHTFIWYKEGTLSGTLLAGFLPCGLEASLSSSYVAKRYRK